MKRPVIVLTPSSMPMEAPFNMHYTYTNGFNTGAISKLGGLPVIPQFVTEEMAEQLMEMADGLFMTGGADIDPALYNEEKLDCCGTVEYDRDKSDINLMKAAMKFKKPILCICRGCQLGNVVLGGSMYQDIPTQFSDKVRHSNYDEYMNESAHTVDIVKGTPLYDLLGKETIGVNALHHQGIKTIAPKVVPMAYAPDGLVESWYYDDEEQWIRAYQWHPEMIENSDNSTKILSDFLRQCVVSGK